MSGKKEENGEEQVRAKAAPKAGKSAAKKRSASTKNKAASVKEKAGGTKKKAADTNSKAAGAKKKAPVRKTKTPTTKTKKPKAKEAAEPAGGYRIGEAFADPIGDVSDGEARFAAGAETEPEAQAQMDAYRAETESEAADGTLEARPKPSIPRAEAESSASARLETEESNASVSEAGEDEAGMDQEAGPAARLERLQKILSQAGVASRRRAEEMIVAGRVMVNGQVVTQLGSKADPARDHIRVDGKLLHGAERHRYFVLNKPKGYVTTVSDPEGRPTVMEFFAKMRERLYPVGRLDYQSEGLLLMTNDGELANQLSKAGTGVDKTYLVKVAGRPSEEELERLRSGVAIERGQAGGPRVRTAPARIRLVREGGNPWYEVVLIEGRNRELRKMFAAIGHFVEKIRRVGYGPLDLDLEPGKFRELTVGEVAALRLTAEGKLKPGSPQTGLRLRGGKPRREQTGFRTSGGKALLPKPAERPARRMDRAGGRWIDEQPGTRGERPLWKERGSRERKEWEPREQSFGQRRRFGGMEKKRATGKAGRFGGTAAERRPFRDQPEFEAGPEPRFESRFEGRRFAGRPRQTDEEAGFEETPRRAFRPGGKQRGIERPARAGKRFGRAPGKGFGQGAGKGRAAGQRLGAELGKGRANEPGKDRSRPRGGRAGGPPGSAPGYRGQGKPEAGNRMQGAGQAKPSFGARAGGFSQSGYKGRSGNAKRSGPRRPGKPWGGKRRG